MNKLMNKMQPRIVHIQGVPAATIKDGIHFIWVPAYQGSILAPHWLSAHGNRVRIFPPKGEKGCWTVALYGNGTNVPDATNGLKNCHPEDEERAFKQAIFWVKYGISKNP